ncbi:MAG TPA: hypothetical protein VES42_15065 [Pilimelia sp.]|nr:hypothetical protein [Pilimelia sp.]
MFPLIFMPGPDLGRSRKEVSRKRCRSFLDQQVPDTPHTIMETTHAAIPDAEPVARRRPADPEIYDQAPPGPPPAERADEPAVAERTSAAERATTGRTAAERATTGRRKARA